MRPAPPRSTTAILFAAVASTALLACPPSSGSNGATDGGTKVGCSAVGQTCEVSPGKLGSCVQKDGCVGEGCFSCQSQH